MTDISRASTLPALARITAIVLDYLGGLSRYRVRRACPITVIPTQEEFPGAAGTSGASIPLSLRCLVSWDCRLWGA
ncbi:MAG: hypothetical protein M3457_15305 [Chloroflexota bacterium]|nr:hypothetical protein [Chloroflexota bacterium]